MYIVFGWKNDDDKFYYLSKCLKGSSAVKRHKPKVKAPIDPSKIVILREFRQEEDALEYLDQMMFSVGGINDGGTLQSFFNPAILRSRQQGRKITVYKDTGEFIGHFDSVVLASKVLGLKRNGLYDSLNERTYSYYGYVVVDQGKPMRPHPHGAPGRRRSRKNYTQNHPTSTPVKAYKIDGTLIGEYSTIGEAERAVGVTRPCISGCLHKTQLQSGGYQFFFKDEPYIPYVFTKRGRKKSSKSK